MLLLIRQVAKKSNDGLGAIVEVKTDLLLPVGYEFDSEGTFIYKCVLYYGHGEEVIAGKIGKKFSRIVNLNKSMGDMQADGSI